MYLSHVLEVCREPAITCSIASVARHRLCWLLAEQQEIAWALTVCPCAGSTTAQAAEKLGFEKVYYPDAPGVGGFVDAIVEALEQNDRNKILSAV